ncbi:MAG: hypothetical protein WC938_00390 [Candidatus Paceibacterota bacterium]|jgi:hypothetical protein
MKDQSHQKLINYTDYYVDSNKFQHRAKLLRIKLRIPLDGLELSAKLKKTIEKQGGITNFFYCPEELNNLLYTDINDYTKSIIKDFPTTNTTIINFFKFYVLYNERFYFFLSKYSVERTNLCIIEDMRLTLKLNEKMKMGPVHTVEVLKNSFENYPIIIKLHPSISGNDLEDFVEKNRKLIKSYLKKYKDESSKIGKIRKRSNIVKKRSEFIYNLHKNNKELSHKEIAALTNKEFEDKCKRIDYSYVGKIISLQKKMRI